MPPAFDPPRALDPPREPAGKAVGIAAVVAAGVLWGTTGTAQAFLPAGTDPLAVGGVRLLFAAAALWLVVLARGLGRYRVRRDELRLLAIGGIGVIGYNLFFFAGVLKAGVALGTITALGSAPIFVGLIEWLRRGAPPRTAWWLGTGLGVAGAAGILLPGEPSDAQVSGLALCAGAGLSYAVYLLATKAAIRTVEPFLAVATSFGLGALVAVPYLAASDLAWLGEPTGLVLALHLGVLAAAVAYFLFSVGLGALQSGTAATLTLVEPIVAVCLGTLLLGERIVPIQIAGVALVLAGLLIVVRADGRGVRDPDLK